jgi:pimeloyl-ACP methyl ester carboxylesterase
MLIYSRSLIPAHDPLTYVDDKHPNSRTGCSFFTFALDLITNLGGANRSCKKKLEGKLISTRLFRPLLLWRAVIACLVILPTTFCASGQPPLVVTLSANSSGHKEYDDPSGYYTFINYTSVVSLTFTPQIPSKISDSIFESKIADISGTIHFTAHAEDHYFGDNTLADYNLPVSYNLSGQSVYLDFLASDGSVNWIGSPLPVGPDSPPPQIKGLVYAGGLSIMTNFVSMPDPFDLDLDDQFPGSASVTVTGNGSSFQGTVTDASTGKLLAGATVVIGGQTLTTAGDGSFFVPYLPPGSLTIQISDSGYQSYQETALLPPFTAVAVPFSLQPAASLTILDANPMFLSQKLLPTSDLDAPTLSALASASVERAKAAADGVTCVLLRCHVPSPGAVSFSQSGTAGGKITGVLSSNPDPSAQPAVLVNGQYWAFALYTVPAGVPFMQAGSSSPTPEIVAFAASFVPASGSPQPVLAQNSITLVPTPILLVHGLWGNPGDWSELATQLQGYKSGTSPDLIVHNVDYSSYNSLSFAQNAWIIPSEAASLITQCRNNGCAATRVDVVAHSMGGILTRIASNLPDYLAPNNFNKGYLRRLVTVDTPHYGSPSATFLLYYLGSFSNSKDLNWRLSLMRLFGKEPFKGAIDDLNPYTFAGSFKQGANPDLGSLAVPTLTVRSVVTSDGDDVDWFWENVMGTWWKRDLLDKNLLGRNPCLVDLSAIFQSEYSTYNAGLELADGASFINVWQTIFSGQPNDGSVAEESQIGGSSRVDYITGVSHVRAPHSQQVRNDIISALNDPTEAAFDMGGLPAVRQVDLDSQKGWYLQIPSCNPITPQARPKDSPQLSFSEPQVQVSVACGQGIQFSLKLDSTNEWSQILVFVGNTNVNSDPLILTSPPFSGMVMCPSNLLGAASLIAIGQTTNGDFAMTSVPVVAGLPTGVSLLSMQIDPSAVFLDGPATVETIRVTGQFSDSITRDIGSTGAGTTYAIENTNLASIDGQGHVTALQQGSTWIDVVNGAASNRVALNVAFAAPTILGVWPAALDLEAVTNATLSVSGLGLSGASLVQLLRNGIPAQGVNFSNLSVDQSGGFLTVDINLTKAAQPGHYQIVITTPSGTSDAGNSGGNITLQTPLSLEAIHGSSGTFGLQVKGVLDLGFVIEASSDLVTWSPAFTNTSLSGAWETNGIPTSTAEARFYRAIQEQ